MVYYEGYTWSVSRKEIPVGNNFYDGIVSLFDKKCSHYL